MASAAALRDRIRRIEARLEELPKAVACAASEYVKQELHSEHDHLVRQKEVDERRLAGTAEVPLSPISERYIELTMSQRLESGRHFVGRLEGAGDHRQARLWRMQLLSIREQVEGEIT